MASGTSGAVFIQPLANGPADITNAGGLSPYGTMAQGGNVHEWEETAVDLVNSTTGENRALRGGSWNESGNSMRSSFRLNDSLSINSIAVGLRVAGAIPEPGTALLIGIGCVGGAALRRRR